METLINKCYSNSNICDCQTWRIPVREWKPILRAYSSARKTVRHEEFPSGNGNTIVSKHIRPPNKSDMKNSRQGMETYSSPRIIRLVLQTVRHEEFPSGNGNYFVFSDSRPCVTCQTWRIPVREWKLVAQILSSRYSFLLSDMKNSRQGMETLDLVCGCKFCCTSQTWRIPVREWKPKAIWKIQSSPNSQTWRIPVREWKLLPGKSAARIHMRSDMKNSRQGMETTSILFLLRFWNRFSQTWRIPVREWKPT